ncbi:MAG: hypothetical protein AAF773_05110 [Cyanobacteria bacterium P01_D01_bin.115]
MPEWLLKVAGLLAAIATCLVVGVIWAVAEILSVIEREEDGDANKP